MKKKLLTIKKFRILSYSVALSLVASTLIVAFATGGAQQAIGIMADENSWGLYVGAGLAAFGMIGTGLGQGYATAKALTAIGRNPEAEDKIRSTMIIGLAITESAALYSLVLGIMIIFVA